MVKRSQAQIFSACRARNCRQPGDGWPFHGLRMYLATVRAQTLKPRRASSAWMRCWPQSGFSFAIRRTSSLSSSGIRCRPPPLCSLERQRQYAIQPFRCHRKTVSGWTMSSNSRQLAKQRWPQSRTVDLDPASLGASACALGPPAVGEGTDFRRPTEPWAYRQRLSPRSASETRSAPLLLEDRGVFHAIDAGTGPPGWSYCALHGCAKRQIDVNTTIDASGVQFRGKRFGGS